jgi:hypothetical protein
MYFLTQLDSNKPKSQLLGVRSINLLSTTRSWQHVSFSTILSYLK